MTKEGIPRYVVDHLLTEPTPSIGSQLNMKEHRFIRKTLGQAIHLAISDPVERIHQIVFTRIISPIQRDDGKTINITPLESIAWDAASYLHFNRKIPDETKGDMLAISMNTLY